CFGIGAVLGLLILLMRLWIPESPRWLMIHNQPEEAERIVAAIERHYHQRGIAIPPLQSPALRLRARDHTPLREVFH
ncbi:MFS transporter, partial [Klebsiella pneumoniae]|nr:MFS transporter [Klebsiella pneumoniae]